MATALTQFWYRALDEEIGLYIGTTDPKVLRSKLYEARAIEMNPKLESLVVFAPATNDCLFIAKRMVELDPS